MERALILLLAGILLFGCPGEGDGTATPTPPATPVLSPTPIPSITPTPIPTPEPSVPSGPECVSDADCVPAQCCHPTYCVSKAREPNCAGVACTMECAPGTLDCGQGSCACIGGVCGVSWLPAEPTPVQRPTPTPTPFRLCRSTTRAGEWGIRGTTLGEYNGRLGLYEDACMWNGTDEVLVKYYCNLINGSNEVVRVLYSCPTQCLNGACDECECGESGLSVCGADGRTYPSECHALCHRTKMVKYGQCDQTCFQLGGACRTSSDCCSGKCDPWSLKCAECVFDSECPAGKYCGEGACRTDCVFDYDCPAGEYCYGGRCG